MKTVMAGLLAVVGATCGAADLFNGKDLSGWVEVKDHDVTGAYCAAEPTWAATGGVIRTTGTPFGYLRTRRSDYGNFKLRLEYRWWRETAKPNSGVFVRLACDTGTFIPRCYENQLWPPKVGDVLALGGSVLEGVAPRNAYVPSDALWGLAVAAEKGESSEKPFGEWNVLEVEANGDEIVNRLNGVERNRVKGVKTLRGAIALQAEGGAVEFRSITVEE